MNLLLKFPLTLQEELYTLGGPPPCNSGIIRIYEDPNIIRIIPYSHYYRVGGPFDIFELSRACSQNYRLLWASVSTARAPPHCANCSENFSEKRWALAEFLPTIRMWDMKA